jgi:hypothetical protein
MAINEQPADPVRELAARMYVELVGRAFRGTGGTEQFKPEPKAMALLCLKLARAFVETADEVKQAGPVKVANYQAQDADVLSWIK